MSFFISMLCYVFFFFKQKTAYEMRISDWSSDVCSSDLLHPAAGAVILYREHRGARHADGIDARMIAKAPVLDRDHRILHHLRRFAQRQPAAVIGAERQENRAIGGADEDRLRSEEHTSELQSLMRIQYAVLCL